MFKFVVQRLLTLIPLLLGVTLLVFSMLQLVPGDPVRALLGEASLASPEQVERIRERLGLDRPLHIQYLSYVGNALRGDLGTSIRTNRPVLEQILLRLPSTLELTVAGLGFAIVFGTFLGVISALFRGTWIDRLAVLIALLGVSVPSFWLGLLFILVFSVHLGWFPVLGGAGGVRALVLPALTLGLWAAGGIARLARSSMLEVMGQDFVRTARSKGLAEHVIIIRHMLRNALIPIVTIVGIRFGQVLAGTVIIESVFSRQGLGVMLVGAIISKDFPVVQGVILLVATTYVLVNFVVELAYTWIDPRITYA